MFQDPPSTTSNMNSLKDIAKGGWHPESKDGGKGGGKPSWRGDFKGVNTVVGPPLYTCRPRLYADEPWHYR